MYKDVFKEPRKIIFLILLCVIFSLTGCDRYTRYKVATFFFTGVPHIHEKDPLTIKEPELITRADETEEMRLLRAMRYFVHGPYANKGCVLCHEETSGAGFNIAGKKQESTRVIKAISGKLLLPLRDLCIDCHSRKSVQAAFDQDLWIHGPVSVGLCISCHSPHQSPYQYMLLKESSIELCTQCHAEGYITEIEEHTRNEECVLCHNSHLGKDRFLLKKDFSEIF
jgi:predicted CXXCH cytochrome family protein